MRSPGGAGRPTLRAFSRVFKTLDRLPAIYIPAIYIPAIYIPAIYIPMIYALSYRGRSKDPMRRPQKIQIENQILNYLTALFFGVPRQSVWSTNSQQMHGTYHSPRID
jgi:hypothetical protein